MSRLAIFAHFDKHDFIDDYVVIYLEKLKEVVDEIIFVSDCALAATQLQKINHLILDNICQKHGEYDFGSCKRGFFLLKEKYPEKFNQATELVFANDSCYCVGDFKEVFKIIANQPQIDGFGLTDNSEKSHHLQSYFLVFRRAIFAQDFFADFWQNVKKLENKRDIISLYEIGLSELLNKNKKSLKAIFSREFLQDYAAQNQQKISAEIGGIIGFYRFIFRPKKISQNLLKVEDGFVYKDHFFLLLKNGFPLIKCRLVGGFFYSKKRTKILSYFWREILGNFDSAIIENHAKRVFKKVKNVKLLKYHFLKSLWLKLIISMVLALIIYFIKFNFRRI